VIANLSREMAEQTEVQQELGLRPVGDGGVPTGQNRWSAIAALISAERPLNRPLEEAWTCEFALPLSPSEN
jgi:hypothetical protein